MADSGAGSDAKNPLIDTIKLKRDTATCPPKSWKKPSAAPQRKEPARCHHCRLQHISRSSNGLSMPYLGILAASHDSPERACLQRLATSFIHCSVLMIGSDRCSVRDNACGNLRSEATSEQPSGTGMNSKKRTLCGTIQKLLTENKEWFIPCGLDDDAGQVSHNDSLMAINFKSLVGSAFTKNQQDFNTVCKKFDTCPDTLDSLFRGIGWSVGALQIGISGGLGKQRPEM